MRRAGRPTQEDRVNARSAAMNGVGELGGPPAEMDEERAVLWNAVIAIMPPAVLQQADAYLVETLVDAIVFYRRARKDVDENGETIRTEKGVYRNPTAVAMSQHRQAMRACFADLGMSPQARARMGLIAEQEAADPLDDLIGG